MTLTAADRCDRCGAQAYVRTRHPLDHGRTTDMLWCGHHAHEHRAMLAGCIVVDERSTLTSPSLG